MEILHVDPTVKGEEIAEAARSCLREDPSLGVKVSLMTKPFRGTRKAFIGMEEARALMLLKELPMRRKTRKSYFK